MSLRHSAFFVPTAVSVSAAVTGTVTASVSESDIVSGGLTVILTLNSDTWLAAGSAFNAQRQNIIDALNAASSPTNGWNNEVRANEVVGSVVRTSGTIVTITLSAAGSYDIATAETITATIPASALITSVGAVVAAPTFTVSPLLLAPGTMSLMGVGK